MWIGQAQRATASGERIFEIIDEPEEIADRPGRAAAAAGRRRRSASRTSASSTPRTGRCCAASTSTSRAGKTIALIGHTGSGKTTLTSLVPRFYDVTAGRVSIDGVDVRDVTLTSLRGARSASSRRTRSSSPRRVRENIAFGRPDLSHEEVERVARAAQAHEFIERAAEGLRHGDRRARDHALRRPAAAHRDRARARDRPAHPHPRRRDRIRRRDDRGADPRRPPRRRCATGRR